MTIYAAEQREEGRKEGRKYILAYISLDHKDILNYHGHTSMSIMSIISSGIEGSVSDRSAV